jgi:hypothetical protein
MKKFITAFFLLFLFFSNNYSHAAGGWLGIQMATLDQKTIEGFKLPQNTPQNVLITTVIKNSAADLANLFPGDVILEINNQPTKHPDNIIAILSKFVAGDVVNVNIFRQNSEKLIRVKLGERPNDQNFEFVDGSEKFAQFHLGLSFGHSLVYTKYFPKEIVDKYQKDGSVVACIIVGSDAEKKGVKLFDEILLIDGKKPDEAWPIKGKLTELTIKRNNKVIKKTVLPFPFHASTKYKCTSEYSNLECMRLGPDPGYEVSAKMNAEKWAKEWSIKFIPVLDCCIKNNLSVIPFNDFSSEKSFYSLKLVALTEVMNYYRKIKPEGYLNKLKELVEIARNDLVEFDKFLKLYPKIEIPEQYTKLQNAVKNTVLYATGTSSDILKDEKDEKIDIDLDDVDRIKKTILSKIEKTGLNNEGTIKFLYYQLRYLLEAKEYEFIIEHWNKARKEVSWNNKEFSKYFYEVYSALTTVYFQKKNFEAGFEILSEGMKISKNNFQNLHFKSAYGSFLSELAIMQLMYAPNIETISINFKLIEQHIKHLISLSNEEKQKLTLIENDYFTTVALIASVLDIIEPTSRKLSYYPLMVINYLEQNPEINSDLIKPIILTNLIQASIIDDDLKNFQFARNELNIFISEIHGNKEKLMSLLNPAGNLLWIYYQKGFFSEMEQLAQFVYETYNLESLSNHFQYKANIINIEAFKGILEKRNGNLNKAILINEKIFNKLNLYNEPIFSNIRVEKWIAILFALPNLYELYFITGNEKKFKKLNKFIFDKEIEILTDEDFNTLKEIDNSFQLYKTLGKYYLQKKNQKQLTKFIKYIKKDIINYLTGLKKEGRKDYEYDYSNKQIVFQNIIEIALLFIEAGKYEEGKKILDSLYPHIINYYNEQIYQSVWRPKVDDKSMGNGYLEAANHFKDSKTFQQKAYSVAQIGKNTNTSRDLIKSIAKKNLKKDDDENLINMYQNLQQKLLVLSRNKQFQPKELKVKVIVNEKINIEYRKIQKELLSIENLIKKRNPEYFDFLKIKTADIKDLQKLLDDDQAILDYFFSNSKVNIVIIKKDSFKIYNIDSNYNNLTNLAKQIRATLVPVNGKIIPFEVNKSFELNESIFLFLKDELKSTNKLIIVPDGPLNSLPLHVLATKREKNCMDCRTVKFNLNDYAFSYLPTAETLVNMDDYEDKFDFIKSAKFKVNVENVTEGIKEIGKSKTGAELLKKIIKKGKKQKTKDKNELQTIEGHSVYLGVGDPNLYLASQEKISNIDYYSKVTKLRSIFRGGIIEGDKIKEIYGPVDGSSEEIKTVANYLKPLKSTMLLGDDANEVNLKGMEMSQFKIIHFATHGEISGALEGLNEPFLVLTPPDEASEVNDGLLTMTEIMALNTNADLVVLSACNTAAGDMPGTEGFSGLAKSFFISGSKSILVSNWYVETYSAQELVINLFKNIKEHPELTVSENFKTTMIEQLGKDKDKSHPLFWAPFIIVGKDNKFSFNL